MALSINWATRVITVPKADLSVIQLAPTEIRGLDIDAFRLALKDIEDGDEGMAYPDTHRHNTTVLLGGVTYARVVEIINGYTVTFEDGQYAVVLSGANSNIADVTNVNQVSVRASNSAGLIQVNTGGSGLSTAEHDKLMAVPSLTLQTDERAALLAIPATPAPTAGENALAVWSHVVEGTATAVQLLRGIVATALGKVIVAGNTVRIRNLADTKDRAVATGDEVGNRTPTSRDLD